MEVSLLELPSIVDEGQSLCNSSDLTKGVSARSGLQQVLPENLSDSNNDGGQYDPEPQFRCRSYSDGFMFSDGESALSIPRVDPLIGLANRGSRSIRRSTRKRLSGLSMVLTSQVSTRTQKCRRARVLSQ